MRTCFCRQTQMLHQAFIHHRRCLACLISLQATPFTYSQAGGCFTFGSAHAGQPAAILMRMQDGGMSQIRINAHPCQDGRSAMQHQGIIAHHDSQAMPDCKCR